MPWISFVVTAASTLSFSQTPWSPKWV